MTQVDFYLIANASPGGKVTQGRAEYEAGDAKDVTVCKLANKAYRLGHRIYILTANEEESQRLDRLLWTFNAGSFVPHALNSGEMDAALPVLIGHQEPPTGFEDVLISLVTQVPDCVSRFQRVAEVVDDGNENKQRARERFRCYRDRGYPLQTHNL